jgi:hypothetical protein
VSLTYGLSGPEFGSTAQAAAAAKSFTGTPVVPYAEKAIYEQWLACSKQQQASGRLRTEDAMNPEQLNRLDWYTATGWTRAYPGDSTILAPDQVPGRNLPAAYLGDG